MKNRPMKLVLNRETLRDLTRNDLAGVDGGKAATAGKLCITTDSSMPEPCHICPITCC